MVWCIWKLFNWSVIVERTNATDMFHKELKRTEKIVLFETNSHHFKSIYVRNRKHLVKWFGLTRERQLIEIIQKKISKKALEYI